MREMTPEEVAAKIILSRKLVKDNAKEIEREAFRLRMVAARKIENKQSLFQALTYIGQLVAPIKSYERQNVR